MNYKTRLEIQYSNNMILTSDESEEVDDVTLEAIDLEFSSFLNDKTCVKLDDAEAVKLSIYTEFEKSLTTEDGVEEKTKWRLIREYYYEYSPHIYSISKTKNWYMKEKKENGFVL